MAIAHSKRYAIPGGMNQSVRNLQKRLLQQKIELKKKLATELAISIDELRKDVEPWVEIVDGKEYVFKKVENISSFGIIHFVFVEKTEFNEGREVRLSFELKR